MVDGRDAYRVLVGRPDGKRPLERPKPRCKDYNKMNIQEARWGDAGWIDLAQVARS
jgi:hypothetical protein